MTRGTRPGVFPARPNASRSELETELDQLRGTLTRLRDKLRAATASEHTESGHA